MADRPPADGAKLWKRSTSTTSGLHFPVSRTAKVSLRHRRLLQLSRFLQSRCVAQSNVGASRVLLAAPAQGLP